MEIIEFICGQLQTGSLPLDQDLINNIQGVVARNACERADRAWLAVAARLRSRPDRAAVPRPRVLWRLDAAQGNHDDAIKQFLQISNPSSKDIDEFFEYLGSKIAGDPETVDNLKAYFSALVCLRPRSAAALWTENFSDSVASMLKQVDVGQRLDFCEGLLDMGRLRDDAALIYLKDLSEAQPANVKSFLIKNQGIIKPEDALGVVRESGLKDAEPVCLEATGDYGGALDALLVLIQATDDDETRAQLIDEASGLCLRVGPTVPAEAAADMWTRLLRNVAAVPPSLLFEAIQYLPLEELVVKTCASVQVASAVVRGGATRRGAWQCAARVLHREVHEALARALAAARRATAVRGCCRRCGRALSAEDTSGARTAHCARAFHAECEVEATCACGRRVPAEVLALPPPPRRPDAAPAEYELQLVAPPRPDLEGAV